MIVICSFPRSGTHFLIDFIRLNFAEFHEKLALWQSSECIYFNLDREIVGGRPWSTASLQRHNVIVKTHRLPFSSKLQSRLTDYAAHRNIIYLTPYRQVARLMASYSAFTGDPFQHNDLSQFVGQEDPFYGDGQTVEERLLAFYKYAMDKSQIIDITATSAHPSGLVERIQQACQATPRFDQPRLPPRRKMKGVMGELMSRMQGRPSSEVLVANRAARGSNAPVSLTSPHLDALDEQLKRMASIAS